MGSGNEIGESNPSRKMDKNREFKHDVYGRRQTAKVNSDFLFFYCNPYMNHTKIKKKCLLLFTPNIKTLILLHGRELKTDGKSFIFAVCRMLNLSNIRSNCSR